MKCHGVIIGKGYLYHEVYLSTKEYREHFLDYIQDIKGEGLGIHFLIFKGDIIKDLLEYDSYFENYIPIENFDDFENNIREV